MVLNYRCGQLGDVELTIRVSKALLEDELQGVAIFSNGVWYETTLAGSERKDMAQYIFGEIDVPRLVDDKSSIPTFDMSRSMQLNRSNELVQKIFAFIGVYIEKVRRELVEEDKKRKATVEAKKLAREAAEIAHIINEDFSSFRDRLKKMRAKMTGGSDLYEDPLAAANAEDGFVLGDDEPAENVADTGEPGHGKGVEPGGVQPPNLGVQVAPSTAEGELRGTHVAEDGQKKRARGGFNVDFRNHGENEARAKYERDERTIYINLDHPQLKAAMGVAGTEDIAFKRLAYEVAFTEYALALAREMVWAGQYYETEEPLIEVRDTINRVSRAASHLYAT